MIVSATTQITYLDGHDLSVCSDAAQGGPCAIERNLNVVECPANGIKPVRASLEKTFNFQRPLLHPHLRVVD